MRSICPKSLGGSALNPHVGHTHSTPQNKGRFMSGRPSPHCVPSLLRRKVSCGWDVWLLSPGCVGRGHHCGLQFRQEAERHKRRLLCPVRDSRFCVLWTEPGRSWGLSLVIKSGMETFCLLYSVRATGLLLFCSVRL